MKSDLNYIIKRIIVGVAIGLILFNIKSCEVHAVNLYFTPQNNNCYIQYLDVSTSPWSYSNSTGTNAYDKIYSNSNNSLYCDFNGILQRSTFEAIYVGLGSRWLNSNYLDKSVNLKFTIYQKPTSITGNGVTTWRYWEIGGLTIGRSLSPSNGFQCDLVNSSVPNSDTNSIATYNYECKNININANTSYYFIISAPKAAANFRISQYFEAVESAEQQINNSINDDRTTKTLASFNGITLTNSTIVSSLVYIPIYFYKSIKSQLNTDSSTCNVITFDKYQLPLHSFINYDDNGITLPCFRNLIEQDLGFTYYETIGLVAGGCLILVYVVRRGRGIIRMSNASNNDEDLWGGLS